MNLRSALAPNIEQSLREYAAPGDGAMWDISFAMVPVPNGAALVGFIIVSMKSLMISQHLVAPIQVDLLSLLDSQVCDRVIVQAVASLREMRAQQAATTNGGPASGGLIVPQ